MKYEAKIWLAIIGVGMCFWYGLYRFIIWFFVERGSI